MKILHLIAGLDPGGAERQLLTLVFHQRQYHHVFVCSLGKGGSLAEELKFAGIPVTVMEKKSKIDLRMIRTLTELLHVHSIELLHCHVWTANFWGGLAGALARTPVVVMHEHSLFTASHLLHRSLFRLLMFRADAVISVSEEIDHALRTCCGVSADRMALIRNGVNLLPLEEAALVRKRGISLLESGEWLTQPPAVAIVGALEPRKDHDSFLRAAFILSSRGINAQYWIIGDGPLRSKLEDLVDQAGLTSSFKFCGLSADVPSILAKVSVYVSTSVTEGISIALLEAMAIGVPIVATAVGGNAEVARGERVCLLVPVGDPEAVANAISTLLFCPGVGEVFADRSRALVSKRYTAERMNRRVLGLYDEVCERVRISLWTRFRRAAVGGVRQGITRILSLFPDASLGYPGPQEIRILTYHRIRNGFSRDRLSVSSRAFARQILLIQELGLPIFTLSEALHRQQTHELPLGAVVLSFDDGYVDCIESALDVLGSAGVAATVYLPAELVDQGGMIPRYLDEPSAGRLLNWGEVVTLCNEGWEIGSHTLSHANLVFCTDAERFREVTMSRTLIAERIGVTPRTFAYPDGIVNQATVDSVRLAGYESATSVWAGKVLPNSHRLLLFRTEISGMDTLADFRWKLSGGFDRWHHFRQRSTFRCVEGIV